MIIHHRVLGCGGPGNTTYFVDSIVLLMVCTSRIQVNAVPIKPDIKQLVAMHNCSINSIFGDGLCNASKDIRARQVHNQPIHKTFVGP